MTFERVNVKLPPATVSHLCCQSAKQLFPVHDSALFLDTFRLKIFKKNNIGYKNEMFL